MNYSQVAEGSANTALPSDAEILEYEQRIREDEAKQHPLVGKRLPLRQLMDKEFADNPPFLGKLQSLIDRHYTSYRSCRGKHVWPIN
jgi:hypothetical protein